MDLEDGFECVCPPQWEGKTCQIGETHISYTHTHTFVFPDSNQRLFEG